MEAWAFTKQLAEMANDIFDDEVLTYLRRWAISDDEVYLSTDALLDFFLLAQNPLHTLLQQDAIGSHLGRHFEEVYFDSTTGDPLLSKTEQRICNLARRLESEGMHIPFRSVQPNKQTDTGDIADPNTYPPGSEVIRYNSGNHFSSRPANSNVFDENSRRCMEKSGNNLLVLFRRGFLEDRLQDIKAITAAMHEAGETQPQFFVICSRHSPKEGHFGASLVIMDPATPDFPKRVLVCDTLLKELPHHPRWWNFFVTEYANVFGEAIIEMLEDLSHPLQKVNVKGDDPYHHDWDCPYYVASMTGALADLVGYLPELLLTGNVDDIHGAMKRMMPDYYQTDGTIKDRLNIKEANRLKRWHSGRLLIQNLLADHRPLLSNS